MMSRIGFGCSSLMGGITRAESLRLLACAYEAGIRHYDVARSYGYGQSEGVVGEFLVGKRNAVTLVTKAGFLPPRSPGALAVARYVAKAVVGLIPALQTKMRQRGAAMVTKPLLTSALIVGSLETSLRELKTDHVDILLLHEASAEELRDEAILLTLQGLKKAGKIRAFGLGSEWQKIPQIVQEHPHIGEVLQFENNPLVRTMDVLPLSHARLVITHRATGALSQRIGQYFMETPEARKKWRDILSTDVNGAEMSRLLLSYSLYKNKNGKVLFSTRNEHHLMENAAVVRDGIRYSSEQFRALEGLVQHLPAAK